MSVIKGAPTEGLSYNPNESKYWDKEGLAREIERIFDICNGCRLCFNLCGSFPELFRSVEKHEGDARRLEAAEIDRVVDLCFQCKICYVKCPYTPEDKHEFQLDFPRLMLRAKAVRARRKGLDLRSRVLSHPEAIGKLAKSTAGLANWANRQPILRAGLEQAIGIHRDKLLPKFHSETFEDWLRSRPAPAGDPNRAVLFVTCSVNYNAPEVGMAAVEVYEKNGIALSLAKHNCCGMPAMEAGNIELTRQLARNNVESLLPHARAGKKIVVIDPTCSYTLRKEYPEIVGTPEAAEVAAATVDVCEYLFQIKQQGLFNRKFLSTPGIIAYHLPCHLRAQNIGYRSRDMMRLIPGTTIKLVEQCCGHDGTWAMKKEFFPLSMLTGKKAFDQMREAGADVMATDCPLAAVQFEQAIGTHPLHPIQVLARAYRAGGFPKPVEKSEP
jgi:glycerol-3-phosphate dehydrogenase subunit C